MANPDFTGPVPSRRCETCKSWSRFPSKRHGRCEDSASLDGAKAIVAITSDLAVCSNWEVVRKVDDDAE